MPKPLSRQSKEMVISLIKYFEAERYHGSPLLNLKCVRERVANALKLGMSTVNRLSSRMQAGELAKSPKKVRPHKKNITDLSASVQAEIRDVIYDMYKQKEYVTVSTLATKLQDRCLFMGGKVSLWKMLRQMGFKWQKDDPRRGLMELSHIAFKRVKLVRSYLDYKSSDLFQFVFLDETLIFQDGTASRSWQDNNIKSVKTTKVNGKRYIVLHAGNESGFIEGAELVFSSSSNQGDYHGEINKNNFLMWFENQLLINLEQPSVIAMNNAPYHSSIENKLPTTVTKKEDIQKWLRENNIDFTNDLLKCQLLEKVKQHKPPQKFVADTLAEQYGHRVLSLPPYHCIFNPIEEVWGITKSYYNKHVGRDGRSVEHCLNVWREALHTVSQEIWANCIQHTENEIQKWWEREQCLDHADIVPIIISVDDKSDSDSESCCWDLTMATGRGDSVGQAEQAIFSSVTDHKSSTDPPN